MADVLGLDLRRIAMSDGARSPSGFSSPSRSRVYVGDRRLVAADVISRAAGGLTPFDVRPTRLFLRRGQGLPDGADAPTAKRSISTSSRASTRSTRRSSARRCSSRSYLLAPARWGGWRCVLALVAIPGAVFDYLENARGRGHAQSRRRTSSRPTWSATASRWTVAKSMQRARSPMVLAPRPSV